MRTKSLKKNTINVVTLGCSKNIYDSEVLMGQLQANDKQVVHEKEGNIVVNTCGFIDNAKEESVQTILNFAKKKEEGSIDKLFVTGCLSVNVIKMIWNKKYQKSINFLAQQIFLFYSKH